MDKGILCGWHNRICTDDSSLGRAISKRIGVKSKWENLHYKF